MLASSVYRWPSAALSAGSLVLYVYLSVVSKVTRSGSALARASALRLAPRVLFPRDTQIAGETAGLVDWILAR